MSGERPRLLIFVGVQLNLPGRFDFSPPLTGASYRRP